MVDLRSPAVERNEKWIVFDLLDRFTELLPKEETRIESMRFPFASISSICAAAAQ